jgi:hypothetical protein
VTRGDWLDPSLTITGWEAVEPSEVNNTPLLSGRLAELLG